MYHVKNRANAHKHMVVPDGLKRQSPDSSLPTSLANLGVCKYSLFFPRHHRTQRNLTLKQP